VTLEPRAHPAELVFGDGAWRHLAGFAEGLVRDAVARLAVLVPFKAIIQSLKDAINPIIDQFSELFAGVGEGADVFGTVTGAIQTVVDVFSKGLYGVLRLLQKPLVFLGKAIAFIIGVVKDVVTAIADWVAGLEFVQTAIATVKAAIAGFIAGISAVGESIGDFLKSVGFIEEDAPAAADAIDEVADASDAANDEILKLAQGVNELAQGFNNALAAAQANLGNLTAAGAATGKYRSEIAKAAKELRKLEQAQDQAALAGDPARQRAIADQLKAATAETVKLNKELTANLIVDAQERATALLKIQQDYDAEQLEAQIASQKAIVAIGGAGVPEAKAALEALNEQRNRLVKQQAQDQVALEAQFQAERLAKLQASEQLIVSAMAAINDRIITQAQKQLDARNLTQGNIDTLIAANVKAIKDGAEQEVKALIESLPDYQKARQAIDTALSTGQIDANEAQKRIKDLLASFRNELEASAGDDILGQQVRTILANGEDAAIASAKAIRQAIQDAGIAQLSSDVLRGIDEQVVALERQRDVLLQNVALTEAQRTEIEQGYAKAIEKVKRGPLVSLQTSIVGIGEAIQSVQFDLNSEGAEGDAEDVKKKIEEINAALREGKITYQEALEQLAALDTASTGFLDTLGSALGQALQQTSDAIRTATESGIQAYKDLLAEQKKVQLDSTLTEEKRAEELARLNELTAKQQAAALESIGAAAGVQFATLISQGEDVGAALKAIAGDTVKSLLALYTPAILALFQSVIPPPFGLIAGSVAIAGLQALVASALAGFEEGGFTGGTSTKEVRGVVHGKEFVANASTTKREGKLLKFLHAGGTSEQYYKQFVEPKQAKVMDISGGNGIGQLAGILTDVRDRLDRIPNESMMRQSVALDVGFDSYLYQKNMRRQAVRRLR